MELQQIGVIRTPYKKMKDVPFNDSLTDEICELVFFPEFEAGLKDADQASHYIILYWLDKAKRTVLQERNPHDKKKHGIFVTRTPNRPNPVGISVAELVEKKGAILKVRGITALDKTPLLDIKPYFSGTDSIPDATIKWFEKII